MGYLLIVVGRDRLFTHKQNRRINYIPISKQVKNYLGIANNDRVILFHQKKKGGYEKSFPIGMLYIEQLLTKKQIERLSIIDSSQQYVLTLRRQIDAFPSQISLIEHLDNCSSSDILQKGKKAYNSLFVSIDLKTFEKLCESLFQDIWTLRNKLRKSSVRLQKKLAGKAIYDLDSREIHSKIEFLMSSLNDEFVDNYIRNRIDKAPESINRYWHLISSISDENIYSLSPENFEKRVTQIFSRIGFKTIQSPYSRDEGVDVFVENYDLLTSGLYIIQCKRTMNRVSDKEIDLLYAAVKRKNAIKGILISVSGFTTPAIKRSKELGSTIEIMTWENLLDIVKDETKTNE